MARVRLAIIGCGAIAAHAHLPAAAKAAANSDSLRVTALVDTNLARAARLAERYGISQVAETFNALRDPPEAAIVALPHHLHAPVAIGLLQQGVHVLVEKPMALSCAQAHEMLLAAESGGATLAVGLVRRFLPEVRLAKQVIESGTLGEVQSFDVMEGRVYAWPSATSAPLRKDTAGGGVFMDLGVHVLDTLLYWLGEIAVQDYADDSYGGVEAEAVAALSLFSGARGRVELSRTRELRNTMLIQGSGASLEVDLYRRRVILNAGGVATQLSPRDEHGSPDIFCSQLEDWVDAIRSGRKPAVSGSEGSRSLRLIEDCYARRRTLLFPWIMPNPAKSAEGISA